MSEFFPCTKPYAPTSHPKFQMAKITPWIPAAILQGGDFGPSCSPSGVRPEILVLGRRLRSDLGRRRFWYWTSWPTEAWMKSDSDASPESGRRLLSLWPDMTLASRPETPAQVC
jgi:hypothetical protein